MVTYFNFAACEPRESLRSLINTLLVIAGTRWSCAAAARHLKLFFFFLFNKGSELMPPLRAAAAAATAAESKRKCGRLVFFLLHFMQCRVFCSRRFTTWNRSSLIESLDFGIEPKKRKEKEEEAHATFFFICFDGLSVFTASAFDSCV